MSQNNIDFYSTFSDVFKVTFVMFYGFNLFPARCYARRGYEIACRLFVV